MENPYAAPALTTNSRVLFDCEFETDNLGFDLPLHIEPTLHYKLFSVALGIYLFLYSLLPFSFGVSFTLAPILTVEPLWFPLNTLIAMGCFIVSLLALVLGCLAFVEGWSVRILNREGIWNPHLFTLTRSLAWQQVKSWSYETSKSIFVLDMKSGPKRILSFTKCPKDIEQIRMLLHCVFGAPAPPKPNKPPITKRWAEYIRLALSKRTRRVT